MLETLGILTGNYAWLLTWLITCLVPGIACCSLITGTGRSLRSPWPNPELALFFTISTGLALQILCLIALAVSGLLSAIPIMLSLSVLLLASVVFLKLKPSAWSQFAETFKCPGIEWLAIFPVLLLILPWILRPLGPPSGTDALTYHLPYARYYLEQGGLVVNETFRYPLHTHSVNLLYAAAALRPGAVLAQLMHASMGFLALLGVYGMSRHWHGWFSAALTVGGVLLFAEFVRSFGYAYVGNGVVLFVTAAFLSMALWIESSHKRLIWFGAFFAGIAMGIKYQGAFFTVPLGLLALWFSRDFKLTVRFALLTSVTGIFWYAHSWWVSGNPVHPFAGEIFGYYIWTAEDLVGQMHELSSHGVDKNLLNFLLLPERMFSARNSFNGYTGYGGILIGAFMLSCFLFYWQKPFIRALQLFCLIYLVFWFSSSQVIRYLLLAAPIISLCTVTALTDFLLRSKIGHKLINYCSTDIPGISAGRIGLILTLIMLGGFAQQVIRMDLHRVPLNQEQQTTVLSRDIPAYDLMIAAASDTRIGKGPILQFRIPESKYFFPGAVYGDWMGRYSYKRFGHVGSSGHWEINDSETLHRQVTAEGFTAVAFRKGPDIQFSPQAIESYREHFDIRLETESGALMIPKH